MVDRLGDLYVATLVLAVIGMAVFVNVLLTHGLRWACRRIARVWRHRTHAVGSIPSRDAARRASSSAASALTGAPSRNSGMPSGQRAPLPDRSSRQLAAH